jgi:hypothetical protein
LYIFDDVSNCIPFLPSGVYKIVSWCILLLLLMGMCITLGSISIILLYDVSSAYFIYVLLISNYLILLN